MIRVGVIGYGYWGPNLVRNLHATAGVEVARICDADPQRRKAAHADYPWVPTSQDPAQVIEAEDLQAVAIATPVATHFALGRATLAAGKHVLMEKPLATSADQAAQLVAEAQYRRRVLMVDHPFVYAPAVQRMRVLVDEGRLGQLLYYDSVRANLGRFRTDVDVLWDLAVHDLSILDYLLGARAVEVSAVGTHCLPGPANGSVDLAYLTVRYAHGPLAHVHVNWLAPMKIRRAILGGSRSMLVFDDVESSEKLKHYDHGVEWTPESSPHASETEQRRIGYRTGDVWSPRLPVIEPLRAMCAEFAAAITERRAPLTDGHCGLRVLQILEAASASLRGRGTPAVPAVLPA